MKIHHIAYAVTDIESARKKFEYLGYCVSQPVMEDDGRGIRIEFLRHADNGVLI